MNFIFEINQINFFYINGNESCDYSLDLGLKLVNRPHLITSMNYLRGNLKNWSESNDSHITTTSSENISKMTFKSYGDVLHIEVGMSIQKLLILYEEIKNKSKFTSSVVKINLTEKEVLLLPTKEEIEDDIEKSIEFKNYQFQLVNSQ